MATCSAGSAQTVGGTDQRLSEPPREYGCQDLVRPEQHYKSELLLTPTQSTRSISGPVPGSGTCLC